MAVAGFQIGIEVEMFLSFKKALGHTESGLDLDAFAAELMTSYNKKPDSSLTKMVVDLAKKTIARSEWTLTYDNTMEPPGEEESIHYPLEIVSPVLEYKTGFHWSRAVTQLWDCIKMDCDIYTNKHCSTHVHISPLNKGPWDMPSLKSICRSIIHFEEAFEIIIPTTRRENWYCINNRLGSPFLAGKSDQECFRMIEDCSDFASLIRLMQGQLSLRQRAWNFLNLRPGRIGTIEFRQAPGVIDASGCLGWVELGVSFVQSATQRGSAESLQKFERTVEGLKTFIDAAFVPGMNQPELLTSVFENKSGGLKPTIQVEDIISLEP
ncbi:hypothetical protein MMC11_004885 [Xylographa trunciseda]|nr:hypothetical protein [Xylographa trunciseda]